VNTTITRESLVADFRTVRKVQTTDAEVFTRAQFTIEDRTPGLNQTADNPPPAATRTFATPDNTVAWETTRP
jgi:alkaline phosphatase D